LSRLQVDAGSKLGDVDTATVQAEEAKEVAIVEKSNGFLEKAFLSAAIALIPLVDVEVNTNVVDFEVNCVALEYPLARE
jgi:hypothetical protein